MALALAAIAWWCMPSAPENSTVSAGPYLDLSDPEARSAFLLYSQFQKGLWPYDLAADCDRTGVETYRVAVFKGVEMPAESLVEVRTESPYAAIALHRRRAIPPPPPPRPAVDADAGRPSPAERPSEVRVEPNPLTALAVSADQLLRIRAIAQALPRDSIPLVSGTQAPDAPEINIEYCEGGRYRYYRVNDPAGSNPQSLRVLELANALLLSGGLHPLEPSR